MSKAIVLGTSSYTRGSLSHPIQSFKRATDEVEMAAKQFCEDALGIKANGSVSVDDDDQIHLKLTEKIDVNNHLSPIESDGTSGQTITLNAFLYRTSTNDCDLEIWRGKKLFRFVRGIKTTHAFLNATKAVIQAMGDLKREAAKRYRDKQSANPAMKFKTPEIKKICHSRLNYLKQFQDESYDNYCSVKDDALTFEKNTDGVCVMILRVTDTQHHGNSWVLRTDGLIYRIYHTRAKKPHIYKGQVSDPDKLLDTCKTAIMNYLFDMREAIDNAEKKK